MPEMVEFGMGVIRVAFLVKAMGRGQSTQTSANPVLSA